MIAYSRLLYRLHIPVFTIYYERTGGYMHKLRVRRCAQFYLIRAFGVHLQCHWFLYVYNVHVWAHRKRLYQTALHSTLVRIVTYRMILEVPYVMARCIVGAYADCKGPDQTAHARSLIRAFAVRDSEESINKH